MTTSDLSSIRHTLAHVLAAAVHELYPHAKATIGPVIDTGFYYDFDFSGGPKPGDHDLKTIEESMRATLSTWTSIEREDLSEERARGLFPDNAYKMELIDEIVARGEALSCYKSCTSSGCSVADAVFVDLCRGGHVEHPQADIPADCFMLERTAGAYWRGDEKNTMLTRIYGLAFESKSALESHLTTVEEARKRDHKVLGRDLDLFTFSELVGAGLPLWTPRGTLVRNLLDDFVWELRRPHGYLKVEIPHITKKDLYVTSGHWDKFKDELFRITTREGHEFAMKPMNCPHHTQIYARRQWSYRDLPQRYANTTMCYRDEQSGELSGLSRVRSLTQDDAHVFCRMDQTKDEFLKVWDIVHTFYHTFGFDLRVRLSMHDPAHPEKYLGGKETWETAEGILRTIVTEKNADWFEGVGEAAFYGPKLDFMAKDALGRDWQVATIQLDLNLPERFDLTCVNEQGVKERIVMIHAAIMGSIDRFLSILIEHTAGAFPLWLSPVQVRVLPIGEAHRTYADEVLNDLIRAGIRADMATDESLGKRIRAAKQERLPAHLVIGSAEQESRQVKLERRDGTSETGNIAACIASLTADISARR